MTPNDPRPAYTPYPDANRPGDQATGVHHAQDAPRYPGDQATGVQHPQDPPQGYPQRGDQSPRPGQYDANDQRGQRPANQAYPNAAPHDQYPHGAKASEGGDKFSAACDSIAVAAKKFMDAGMGAGAAGDLACKVWCATNGVALPK